MEERDEAVTISVESSNSDGELSNTVIIIICVIAYLVIVTIVWFIRKCLVNQGVCRQCDTRCDCCLCLRDCCIACSCKSCSANGCLEEMNCRRQRFYCIDLLCCRCLCPEDSTFVNCCYDMASGSCECCGCTINFSAAPPTSRSPRQMPMQPSMYPPNMTTQPLGTYQPPYTTGVPQSVYFNPSQTAQYPVYAGTYPQMGSFPPSAGQIPTRSLYN